MPLSRSTITAGLAAMSLALGAAPALASGGSGSGGGGGGGGGSTTAVDQNAVPWALCPAYAQGPLYQADGSTLFANQYTGVGCLVVRSFGSGLSIWEIDVAAGWVREVKSSHPDKIDVLFTYPPTGEKHEIMVQPGKTVVR